MRNKKLDWVEVWQPLLVGIASTFLTNDPKFGMIMYLLFLIVYRQLSQSESKQEK